MKRLFRTLALLTTTASLIAGLREPDAVLWGSVILDRVAVTAAATDVTIEARRTPSGPPVASYKMGSLSAAGNFYSLRLTVESSAPLSDPNALAIGESIYIVVKKGAADRDSKPVTIDGRGVIQRLDFGSLDADNDGILDDWEIRYFGSTGANPNADNDSDGATNLREFIEGTNPTVKDARHPADRSPNDGRISINEVTTYGLAWRNNTAWPTDPNPIPISYVTRAGALWRGGEVYLLNTNIASTAPLWWTNPPVAFLSAAELEKQKKAQSQVTDPKINRTILSATNGFTVHLSVTPSSVTAAYAVEELAPPDWSIEAVSENGHVLVETSAIRWGPFMDSQPREIFYTLVSKGVSASIQFSGSGSFDGIDVAIEGVSTLPDIQSALNLSADLGAVTVHGTSGLAVVVEVSDDLRSWTTFEQTQINAQGQARISISTKTNAFFRARLAP
jgi:hypothetical protein